MFDFFFLNDFLDDAALLKTISSGSSIDERGFLHLTLICPFSSTRKTLEQPKRQEQERTQREAGMAKAWKGRIQSREAKEWHSVRASFLTIRKTYLVSSTENLVVTKSPCLGV